MTAKMAAAREKIHLASKHRLLLADDSVTIQKVVNLTFADEGIEVVAVGDGDQAMQKFVEAVPDLVMVDVNMPGVDGYRICEMIKQDDETKHIPVILLVGSFEPFDEEEARRVGADDFLTKPFQSIRQLVNKVSDLLNRKTGGETVGSFNDTLETIPSADDEPTENTGNTIGEPLKADFGDAAMDDDLIQTNQIGSLPVNDAAKLEIATNYQPPDEFDQFDSTAEPENEREEAEAVDDKAVALGVSEETDAFDENLPDDDLEKFDFLPEENFAAVEDESAEEILPRHENIHEFADAEFAEESEVKENVSPELIEENEEEDDLIERAESYSAHQSLSFEKSREDDDLTNLENDDQLFTESKILPSPELDDFDLLELNPSRNKRSGKTENTFRQRDATVGSKAFGELSPETIELIADRVVEKFSDETVEKIVREVVARLTEKR